MVKSPKSEAFPVDAMVTNSIVFKSPGTLPPAGRAEDQPEHSQITEIRVTERHI